MALDKAGLTTALTTVFTTFSSSTTPAGAAAAIADAIDTYVKTGAVAFTAGKITGADVPTGDSHANLTAVNGVIS